MINSNKWSCLWDTYMLRRNGHYRKGKIVPLRWFWNCCIHPFVCYGENDLGKLSCFLLFMWAKDKCKKWKGNRSCTTSLKSTKCAFSSSVKQRSRPPTQKLKNASVEAWVITFLQISHCNFCSCWFVCGLFLFLLIISAQNVWTSFGFCC